MVELHIVQRYDSTDYSANTSKWAPHLDWRGPFGPLRAGRECMLDFSLDYKSKILNSSCACTKPRLDMCKWQKIVLRSIGISLQDHLLTTLFFQYCLAF